MPLGVHNVDGPVDYRLAVVDRLAQRTTGFTDAGPENIAAGPVDRLVAWDTGYLFSGPVEVGDPPVGIHGENAIARRVEDGRRVFGEEFLFHLFAFGLDGGWRCLGR